MRLPKAKLKRSISNTVPMGNKAAAMGVEDITPKSRKACIVTATRKMLHATKYQGAEGLPFRQLTMDNISIAGAESAPRLTRL